MKTYPLLQSQLGIFLEWIQTPSMTKYNLPTLTPFPKSITVDKIESMLRDIIDARPELRTRFVLDENGNPRQYSDPDMNIPISRFTITEDEAKDYIKNHFVRPYDPLAGQPLCRFEIIEAPEYNYLLLEIHHAIGDGLTLAPNMTIHDMPAAYYGTSLAEVPYGMYQYAEDEEAILHSEQYERAKEYYTEKFAGMDFANLSEGSSAAWGNSIRESSYIPVDLIDNWCKEHGTTSNLLFMAAFSLVISRITREQKIAYHTLNHGRMDKRLMNAYGMFVRSVPILADVDDKQPVIDFVKGFRRELMATIRYGAYPFNHFCRDLKMSPNISFGFQGVSMQEFIDLDGIHIQSKQLPKGLSDEPLACIIYMKEGIYEIRLDASDAQNSRGRLRMLADAIHEATLSMMQHAEEPLSKVNIISDKEQELLMNLSAGKHIDVDISKTFAQVFEERAQLVPDNIAVADKSSQLTYKELSHRSNVLAHQLVEAGVQPNDFVCVMLDRYKEFPLSVLAIHKAGAAYTPMDFEYPNERLQYMLENSESKVLITSHAVLESKKAEGDFETGNVKIIFIEDIDFNVEAEPINLTTPDNLAYMIYTSGSTGKPKGAMLHQAGLWNFINIVIDMEKLTADDRIEGHRSFSFDAHIEDMYAILTLGGSFHIMPTEIRKDLAAIRDFLFEHKITGGGYSTAIAALLLNTYDDLPVRFITAGGEKLDGVYSDHIEIINVYGPTECTDDTSYYSIAPGERVENIPIGKPVANTWNFIVDGSGNLVPHGMVGELCIAGIQVGRGYWRLPERTAQSFVDCPFVSEDRWGRKVRMYHTGDLCRWNEQGDLEYMGRIDFQVKLRGFRIELGEIESKVLQLEGILQAAAEVRKVMGTEHLILYYTLTDGGTEVTDESIRKALEESSLADYMVPDTYMKLDIMPITPNGKINRKLLPLPEIKSNTKYVEPEGETEKAIAEGFASVLGLSIPIGALDSFYALGGDSIKSIRLVSQLRKQGIELQVSQIMKLKTVRALAEVATGQEQVQINQEPWSGSLANSAIVQYFFDLDMPTPAHFNQAIILKAKTGVEEQALRKALDALVEHHDMLRAVVSNGQLEVRNENSENLYSLTIRDFRGHADAQKEVEQEADLQNASIKLTEGPLFRVALMRTDEQDLLLLVAHHLVVDGVSWRIIAEDINTAYAQAQQGVPVQLPAKTHSYRDYVEALSRYKEGYMLKRQAEYWKEVRQQMQKYPCSSGKDYSRTFDSTHVSLDINTTHQLLTETSHAYNTEINDLLLTALGRAYQQLTQQDNLSIQLEGHGREPIGEPLYTDRTVGWFTSLFPVVLTQLGGDLRHDIRQVKETLHRIPNKGLGYGQLYGMDTLLQPLVCLNYLGEFGNESAPDVTFVPDSEYYAGQMVAPENTFGPGLTIDTLVSGGALHVNVRYDTDLWGNGKADKLANGFLAQLSDIVQQTATCNETEPTASDFGELEWDDEEFLNIYQAFEARGEHIRRIYPLTPMQQGMVLKSVMEPDSTAYRLVFALSMDVLPTETQLRAALDALAIRHEVLRTAIIVRGTTKYRQAIVDGRQLGLRMMDITDATDPYATIADIRQDLLNHAFDLQDKPLFNLVCLKTSDTTCTLMFVFHHIIEDGWCLPIIQKDLFTLLSQSMAGSTPTVVSAGDGCYERYVRDILAKDSEPSLNYWRTLLEGYESPAVIPSYSSLSQDPLSDNDTLTITLTNEEQQQLARLTQTAQVTPNTVVETAWGILLQRFNRTDDVVFAKVVSGRDNTDNDVSNVVGIFINTIPVRVQQDQTATIMDVLRNVQTQAAESNRHDYLSLSEIQQQTSLGKDLFQSILVFENYPTDDSAQPWPFTVKPVITKEENFDEVSLVAYIDDSHLALELKFDNRLYTEQQMLRTLHALQCIIHGILANPDAQVNTLKLLDAEDEQELLALGKGETLEYDRNLTLVDVIRHQVDATPDATAIVFRDKRLTYRELDELTDRLAAHLQQMGVKPEQAIGVMIDRSELMAVYPIAIMKAGAAYMPLDCHFPEERLQFMCEDAGVSLILADDGIVEQAMPHYTGKTFCASELNTLKKPEKKPIAAITPDNMFVILYTSGSTGKPKGCMLEHGNIVNFCHWYIKEFNVTQEDRAVAYANFGFDAHMLDLYPALSVGASVYIIPSDLRMDLMSMNKYMEEQQLTIAFMTTQIGYIFATSIENHSLRLLSVGGEKLQPLKKPPFRFYNAYGPTECTLYSTCYNITKDYNSSLIGRPLANYQLCIVDKNMNLVPRGIPGELVVMGVGVGRGYLNRPDVNAEKFITMNQQRAYRTGDLVRWSEEGNIDYIGRIDGQVKLRGLRIELGEIESRVAKHESIKQVCVDVKEIRNVQNLVCYYIEKEGHHVLEEELKSWIGETLTAFMVPEFYVKMDKFPFTPNGKVNRRELPLPEAKAEEIIAPETDMEQKMWDITSQLLKTDQLGVTSNLISMGLTSLSAMRLSALFSQKLNIKISVKDILAKPYLRDMANSISQGAEEQTLKVDYTLRSSYPMTENQRGVYIDWDMNREALQYNIPFIIEFPEKDSEQLKRAIEAVIEAHPYLKTRFVKERGDVCQQRRDDAPVNVTLTTLDEEPSKEFFRTRLRPFNLFTDDLYRFEIYQTPSTVWLFMDIHHIIYDGASSLILMNDLERAYEGEELLRETYTAFERALDEEALKGTATYQEAVSYFDKLLPGVEMASYPHSDDPIGGGNQEENLTFEGQAIIDFCQQHGVTASNYFLTSFMQVLHRITREESIYITTIDNGRTDVRMMSIMGMFVKTLPVVSNLTPEEAYKKSMAEAVADMQKQFVETQGRSFYPFTEMVERHGIRPEIMYAYQGKTDDIQIAKEEALQLDTVKMPLSVSIYPESEGRFTVSLEYDGQLYSQSDMHQLAKCIANFSIAAAQSENIASVSLLDEESEKLTALQSSGTSYKVDPNLTFVDIFMQRAVETPDAPAVIDEKGQYTYGELNALTAAVAKKLVALGVKPNNFVSIMLGYQKEFLVAAIAVEKAGGAYVPLDYDYPNERLQFMMEDSESQVLITSHAIFMEKNVDGEFNARNIFFIDDYIKGISIDSVDTSLNNATPEGLAYMIYTSGSTGKPKGVMISHRAKANFVQFIAREWRHTNKSRICCHSSFSFDASIEDLYPVLTVGGTLYTVPQEARKDLTLLSDFIINNGITGGCYTTQLGQMLLQLYPDLPVDYLVVGGEKMTVNPECKCRLINTYGPTEFTVDATFFELEKGREYKNIPIGRPLHNLSAYVVDSCGHLLPQGMSGELCMAGPQMASGYWKREDLTAEKFSDITVAGQKVKVYHTGDLVRYNADNEIEYQGRIDSQVKLRGFRIELGEIETLIGKYEGIQMESVQVREIGGVQHLCAYYTADKEIDKEALRSYLAEELTDYMVPTAYIQLDEMPLTPNGKVNTKALPNPNVEVADQIAPSTPTEEQLFKMVSETLKHNQFGVTTNLISMGLTSLSAMRFAVAIHNEFGIEMTVKDLLQRPTVREIAEAIDTHSGQATTPETKNIETWTKGKQYYHPITENQRGVFLDWELNSDTTQYNVPEVHLMKDVSVERLRKALETVVNAHPYLKTRFVQHEGDVMQIRRDEEPVIIHVEKLSEQPDESFFQSRVRPFDLYHDTLYRLEIYEYQEKVYLFIDIHHTIYDGASSMFLFNDIIKACAGESITAETYTAFDFAIDEMNLVKSDKFAEAENYFKDLLADKNTTVYPHSINVDKEDDGKLQIPIAGKDIEEFCHQNGLTLNNYFLTMVMHVLHAVTREEDVVITTINNGRSDIRLLGTMGMFVKTLPIVSTRGNNSESVAESIMAMQNQVLESQARDFYPFTKMVELYGIRPEIMYVYEPREDTDDGDDEVKMHLTLNQTKLPLDIHVAPMGDRFELGLEYDTRFYSKEDMMTFAGIIKNIAENATKISALKDIPLLSEDDIRKMIDLSKGPQMDIDQNKTFVEAFEECARKSGDRIAVADSDGQMSYSELSHQSDVLAHYLIENGVKDMDFVGVMLERTKAFPLSVLAIHKSGAAYVPLDTSYPVDRLNYIIANSEMKVVLTTRRVLDAVLNAGEGFSTEGLSILLLDDVDMSKTVTPVNHTTPDHLAYMIYTSGSTGSPKGVMLHQAGLWNFTVATVGINQLTADDRISCHRSFSFDAHIEDLFPILTVGGSLHIMPENIRKDLNKIYEFLTEHQITGGGYNTSIARLLLTEFDLQQRFITCGGESLTDVISDKVQIINVYGPTECTDHSAIYHLEKNRRYKTIPIGRPMPNMYCFIVDRYGRLLPYGIAGELLVAGVQVGRGYWHLPEMTDKSFVECPYISADAQGRRLPMYRTGDICRWNSEGQLEFIGRADFQVKLRGYRIETDEIENVALSIDGIRQVVADVRKVGSTPQLILYYVPEHNSTITEEHVRKALEESALADYMKPSIYVALEEMPTTLTGKINRKLLPTPSIQIGEIVEASSDSETLLLDIAKQLLGNEKIGVTTNLISAGMTSLTAMRLSANIKQKAGIYLPVKDILAHPTIREMAQTGSDTEAEVLKVWDTRKFYPITENQRSLFADWQLNPNHLQYNIPTVERMNGMEAQPLKEALERVVNAHSYLKTRLAIENGDVVQYRHDSDEPVIDLITLDYEPDKDYFQSLIKPFDLLNDRLYRIQVCQTPTSVYLFMDIHHIIFDGGSGIIFFSDLQKAYSGEELKAEKYTAFDHAVNEQLKTHSDEYEKAQAHFDAMLENTQTTIYPHSGNEDDQNGIAYYTNKMPRQEIEDFCRQNEITPHNFMLSALALTLHRVSREDKVMFTAINSGRNSGDMLEMVGMFVKTLPVVSVLNTDIAVVDYIKKIQQQFQHSQEFDFYPFTTMVLRHHVRPEIILVYQNEIANTFEQVDSESIDLQLDTAKLPISVVISENGPTYNLSLEYDPSMFSPQAMEALAGMFKAACMNLVIAEQMSDVSLIEPTDLKSLLKLSRGSKLDIDRSQTFVTIFKQHAQAAPDSVAVVDCNGQFTYGELDRQSDVLAHFLVTNGVRENDFVGIMLMRRKEFLLSVLAIQKAGAAYIPLDMEYPVDRLSYMLEDSNAKAIISTQAIIKAQGQMFNGEWTTICLDQIALDKTVEPIDKSTPNGLAYMIYTSGSTGKPKGVMLPHRALRAYLAWRIHDISLNSSSVNAQHASFSFDASLDDLLCPLAAGGQVHILSEDLRKDLDGMVNYFNQHHVTGMTLSTQLGMAFINQLELPLKYLMMGGEKMLPFRKTNVKVINGYGPTEFSVCSSYHVVDQENDVDIPIGRPVPNSYSFICDQSGNLLPQGVVGELCLSGDQMAVGYWNRPEQTAEKFVNCKFLSNHMMYRTGDLARYNEQGELEYQGRIDNQVKLRGFRIEFGEIETCAKSIEGIQAVIADVKTVNGTQHLVLYYTANREISSDEFDDLLSESLTAYMIPEAYVRLESMPLTPNGKIDRKLLPEPIIKMDLECIAPATKREQVLYDIACELLGRTDFGVTDNLLRIGMTSLLAIRMILQATTKGIPLKVDDFMRTKTIRGVLSLNQELISWYEQPDVNKPVAVLVQGETRYNDLLPYIQKLNERYNVLVIEAITTHYSYLFKEDDISEVIEFYYSMLDVYLMESGLDSVDLFTGHCFGADLSYRLASRWQQSHMDQKVNVCMLDSFWVDRNRPVERLQLDLSMLPEQLRQEIDEMNEEQGDLDAMYKQLNCHGEPKPLNGNILLVSAEEKENPVADVSKKLNIPEEQILSTLKISSDKLRKALYPQRDIDNVALWNGFVSDLKWTKAYGNHMTMLNDICVEKFIKFIFDNLKEQ